MISLEIKAKSNVEINNDVINTKLQPFKELPSANASGDLQIDRIDAHDLFSLYTADFIKNEII